MWRKRVGVEPTPESAKDTGHGFEDHEDHRTPFASANSIADALNAAGRAARLCSRLLQIHSEVKNDVVPRLS